MAAEVPFVLALKTDQGSWAPIEDPHTPVETTRALGWDGPERSWAWTQVVRRSRDGRTATWWAADVVWAGHDPYQAVRLVVATTDHAMLPRRLGI